MRLGLGRPELGSGVTRMARRPALLIGAGVVVLVLMVIAGCVVRTASAHPSPGGVPRWDDFRRPDGLLATPALSVLPSGQRWRTGFAPGPGYAGANELKIENGTLRFDGPGAAYSWTTGDTDPRTASVDFGYEPGSSPKPTSSVGLIVSQETGPLPISRENGVASHSVHAGFSADMWSIGIADGENLQILATGRYRLKTDGQTGYRATLRLTDPDTVEIDTPDGGTHTVTDDRISEFWGPSVLIEHYQPLKGFRDDPRPVITGYAVDTDRE